MPLRIPVNCSSITFTTSGVRTPTARVVSGLTSNEETACVYNEQVGTRLVSTLANGNTTLSMPPVISSITINGNVYVVASGLITAVPAADATAFIGATFNQPFELVSGV